MNKKVAVTLIICIAILIAGAASTYLIFSTEPMAEREGAVKESAMLVEVADVEYGTFYPTIVAMGTVIPSKDIVLQPRVVGELIEVSQEFTPGGIVQKDELLLRIDPSDYKNNLLQRVGTLEQEKAELELELGRQKVAQQEYELLEESLPEQSKKLVLREPQLAAAKASVEAARAQVEQANLELDRTYIKAPFHAQIISRNVNLGSQVSPEDNLARLVGLDFYWVEATVPLSKLPWLNFSSSGEAPTQVKIHNRATWPKGVYRNGTLFRLIGALEQPTRMARVLVKVKDPLALNTSGVPPLMIGSYVESQMKAKPVFDVVRINREYVRNSDTVWVMRNGKLDIIKVEIAFLDDQYAYIQKGLNKTDKIVITNLSTPVPGAKLRLKSNAFESRS